MPPPLETSHTVFHLYSLCMFRVVCSNNNNNKLYLYNTKLHNVWALLGKVWPVVREHAWFSYQSSAGCGPAQWPSPAWWVRSWAEACPRTELAGSARTWPDKPWFPVRQTHTGVRSTSDKIHMSGPQGFRQTWVSTATLMSWPLAS